MPRQVEQTRFALSEDKRYLLLAFPELFKDARVVIVPQHWARGKYISLFDKSPPDIVCPSFWELKWATGCIFNCEYCYLQGTLYGKMSPRLKCLDELKNVLVQFLRWAENERLKVLLNTGELTDSFAIPSWANRLLSVFDEIAGESPNLKVLFVTKGGLKHIRPLIEHKAAMEYSIVSFSINTPTAARAFEGTAPDPLDRINAARLCQDLGFEVRLRLDPLIPTEGWEKEVPELIYTLLSKKEIEAARITIGTLRGLYKTIKFTSNRQWLKFLKGGERTGWGLKMPKEVRLALYRNVLLSLKELGFQGQAALCKETLSTWRALVQEGLLQDPGMFPLWHGVICNCVS